MMSLKDFVHIYKLKKKTTSNLKLQQVLSSLFLNDVVGIYLRDCPFEFDIGITKLHPVQDTHWVIYVHEDYFHRYSCSPPQKLTKFIVKRNGHRLYSEYKIQVLKVKKIFIVLVLVYISTLLDKILRN